MPLGGEEEAPSSVVDLCRRREPERLVGQLGGSRRRAARVGRPRCLLEDRSDLTIRLGRRKGEVPSSFLRARNDRREPCVQRPSARRRLAGGDGRSEQRVGESHALPVQLEDPRVECLGEAEVGGLTERRFDELGRRLGNRCHHPRHLEGIRTEAVEALAQELLQVRGDRQRVAGRGRPASSLERGCELEREEGVAAARFRRA